MSEPQWRKPQTEPNSEKHPFPLRAYSSVSEHLRHSIAVVRCSRYHRFHDAQVTYRVLALTGKERLLRKTGERICEAMQRPDGPLYLLTDNSKERIPKLVPQK